MHLQTVTGPVPIEQITLVDGHAHAWINPPVGVDSHARLELNNTQLIIRELNAFRQAGGSVLIDCQPGGCGRDARMLAKLAQATGLHITATTGFHLRQYYPAQSWLWTATETAALAYFVNELTSGMQEQEGVLATTIKVGYDGKIEGQKRVLMEAVAQAARSTGAAILFHTEQGHNAEALLPFFDQRGVPPTRLYICHIDKRPDVGLHRELATAGTLLGYDTFARPKYQPEQHVWPLLLEMVRHGLDTHIAIGLDLALTSMWQHFGGEPGLAFLPTHIISRLKNEGLDKAVIAKLTGQNVGRFLACV